MRGLGVTTLLFVVLIGCDEYPVESCSPTSPNSGITFNQQQVPFLGNENALVELTLFGDFQCPYTHIFWDQMEQYLEDLENRNEMDHIKIYFRHFPITSIHNRAMAASTAASAAFQQGNDAFWRLFPKLLETGVNLTDDHISYYATTSNLDMDQFEMDLQREEVLELVQRDLNLAEMLTLDGTPSAFICGHKTTGQPQDIIDNLDYLINKYN